MHVVSFYNNGSKVNVNDIDHEHKQNYTRKFAESYYKKKQHAFYF